MNGSLIQLLVLAGIAIFLILKLRSVSVKLPDDREVRVGRLPIVRGPHRGRARRRRGDDRRLDPHRPYVDRVGLLSSRRRPQHLHLSQLLLEDSARLEVDVDVEPIAESLRCSRRSAQRLS